MAGTLFLVVGPSGGGKDTLIAGARARLRDDSGFVFPRRVITRPADAGGEAHEEASPGEFGARRDAGGFMLHWEAHGLLYGIPESCARDLASGRHVVVNVSRAVISEAASRFAPAVVLEVTAPPDVLARRLGMRGRESGDDIGRRLARKPAPIPDEVERHVIDNGSTVADGIDRLTDALLSGTGKPPTDPLRRKIAGFALDRAEYRSVIADVARGRFAERDIADFLVAVTERLTDDETTALARARAEFATRLEWDAELVADKHSMGGIPGNRISMIVVPVVAARGMTIPKTSSRAITSPAGTADAMEVLARVDLDAGEAREVVRRTGGCLVWNGRLNHSRIDDVMNAMTRPLRLDSRRWSVSSILSKKLAAGATHCVIDIPVGPAAKVQSREEATELRDLFVRVGEALGLRLDVQLTDGNLPVGRGIGPALEARDVVAVLKSEPGAPADLRDKAVRFAASALAFDPATGPEEAGRLAGELLDSGAAWETFAQMAAAQGPPPEDIPEASHASEIVAGSAGIVDAIDCFRLAGIARAAGAPADKGAGLDLMARHGARVEPNTPLYRIQARTGAGLDAALARARENHAFSIREG